MRTPSLAVALLVALLLPCVLLASSPDPDVDYGERQTTPESEARYWRPRLSFDFGYWKVGPGGEGASQWDLFDFQAAMEWPAFEDQYPGVNSFSGFITGAYHSTADSDGPAKRSSSGGVIGFRRRWGNTNTFGQSDFEFMDFPRSRTVIGVLDLWLRVGSASLENLIRNEKESGIHLGVHGELGAWALGVSADYAIETYDRPLHDAALHINLVQNWFPIGASIGVRYINAENYSKTYFSLGIKLAI